MEFVWATGRRKTSIARVRIKKGKGIIKVNGSTIEDYFVNRKVWVEKVYAPLKVTDNFGKYDIYINVQGGGLTGQADACSLGIARALVKIDETNKSVLRRNGLLTRDPRMVERKKYGLRKARRARQYSKR
ncbi:MAG TPA: 30S ribosomal protein S9 [Spirochaetota bacterium]|nr:30S ribosomal protein S9 [Spirochaetota bacterium]HOM38005.1 30S ribosomal protein S9 [Spirochaetota bacterium]HPQ48809.1 30S ribosomal protein S9 [Spirochaetota bacterium]